MTIADLKAICRIPGTPGDEGKIREYIKAVVTPLVDEVTEDGMGNLIAFKKGNSNSKTVMTAAHMDEIGFVVRHIDKDGFIRFTPLGGFDPKTLTAQRVIVHGKKDVIGVFGVKPKHMLTPAEMKKAPELDDYYIDLGMSGDKVREIVSIGDSITRDNELIEIGDCVTSKSLDNRVSVYVQIETIKAIDVPAYDTYFVFTTQEEVGLRGAGPAARAIDPDFGINLDVTMSNDVPGQAEHDHCTKIGGGAAIKVLDGTTICDKRMVAFMRDIAKKYDIKAQDEVLQKGGTDTAMIQRSGTKGAIVGGVSIPCRYLHTHVELSNKDDITACIKLMTKCLEDLGEMKV